MILHTATARFPSLVVSQKKHNATVIKPIHLLPRKPQQQQHYYCSCTTFLHLNVGFENVAEIAHNKVLIASAVSAAIGQLSKPFTGSILYGNNTNKNFDFKSVFQTGGFPSTHSSSVVATATSLGLERGFADSIFGLSVVYAALVMYDAQGVRREVGNHAKTLNRILPKIPVYSISSMDRDNLTDETETSTSIDSKSTLLSEETTSYASKQTTLSLKSDNRIRQPLMLSGTEADEKESERGAITATSLKESIGHTEIEVIAGALLGFFVSLTVHTLL